MNKISFLTGLALVFVGLSGHAQTKPIFPGYANCAMANNVIDANCMTQVNNTYQEQLTAYNRATGLISDRYSGTSIPVKPTYICVKDSSGKTDQGCESEYARLMTVYNQDLVAYQTIQTQASEFANFKNSATQARISQVNVNVSPTTTSGSGATQALAAATATNQKGSALYQVASSAMTTMAVIFAAKAAACSATGCAPPLWVKSAAFAALAILAAKQSQSHDTSARASCESQSQLSSTPVNCNEIVPVTTATTYTPQQTATDIATFSTQLDPATGLCKPTAPQSCITTYEKLNEQGIDTRTLAKPGSLFAGGPSKFPIKVNPDGSVTTPDGKTIKPSDLNDADSLVAAGMSQGDAAALMNQVNGSGGIMAKAGLDAKGDLKDLNAKGFGSFEGGSGSGNLSVKLPGEGADGANKFGSKDMLSNGKRGPTSEGKGLTKAFNGESIGIANDDIFKMMTKRYKLKTAQDSFIGQ